VNEKHRILNEFNNIGSDYTWDKLFYECFEEHVAQRPNNIVVIGPGHRDMVPDSVIKRKGIDGMGTIPCVRCLILFLVCFTRPTFKKRG
jgi:hypothetical protein